MKWYLNYVQRESTTTDWLITEEGKTIFILFTWVDCWVFRSVLLILLMVAESVAVHRHFTWQNGYSNSSWGFANYYCSCFSLSLSHSVCGFVFFASIVKQTINYLWFCKSHLLLKHLIIHTRGPIIGHHSTGVNWQINFKIVLLLILIPIFFSFRKSIAKPSSAN